MKKLLNVTLAISLIFQPFLGTGVVSAETTNSSELVEELDQVTNLNEPTNEDGEEQEPIAKEEVIVESEKVEEVENPPKNEESQKVLISEDESYDSDDYVVVTADGLMTLATAYVSESHRIPNTSYDFSSIISTWKTKKGMPKILATHSGMVYAAFCIEPGIMHETGGSMSSGFNGLTFTQQRKINHILMYGYGNNSDFSDDSYVATQVAIWEVVANQSNNSIIWNQLVKSHSNRNRIYAQILDDVSKHSVIPAFMGRNSSNAPTTTLTWNGSAYTTTLTDTNNVLSKYNVVSNNGDVQVHQNGNQLTLTTTNPNADVALSLTKQATTGGNTLYWVSNTKQDLVTGGQDDPVRAYLKINVNSVGNVKIVKKSTSGAMIPNTQFRVTGNGVDTVATTGADGSINVSNLKTGIYTITEVSVPAPYLLDSTPKTVEVKPNETAVVEFTNDVAKGRLEIVKTSELGTLIQGAVFEIRQNGQVLDKVTTGFDGKATSTLLPLGEVEVVEVYVPSPYLLDPTPKKVTLSYADMNTPIVFAQIGVVNQTAKAQLKVTKHGVDGEPVQGAIFDVKNMNGDLVATLTTDLDGVAITQPLDLGTYIATETYVPAPYILDSTPQTIELNYANMTTSVVFGTLEFVNEKAQGYFKLQKVDAETGQAKPQGSASLKGAEYEVRNENGDLVDTLITDENGYAETKLLPLGDYLINETKASEGYLVDPQVYSVSLTYEDMNTPIVTTSVTSNEQVMKQPIEIMKVEGEVTESTLLDKVVNFFTRASGVMKPLQGAEFTITSKTTGQVVDVMVTDETGYAKSIDLPYDTYIVSETKVPHNHYQSSDFEVVINQNSNKPLHYTIANEPVTAYLKVVKVDAETGKVIPLSGVKFKIKNLDTGEYVKQKVTYPYPHTIEVFETNDEGMFITPKILLYGNYQLEEIQAPNGYVISKEPIKFTIDQNDTFIDDVDFGIIKEVAVSNQAVKGQIKVEKVGEFFTGFNELTDGIEFTIEDLALADVTFNIYARENVIGQDGTLWYKKGQLVQTVTTNKNGQALSKKLPLGKYYVTEIKAPNGYVLDGVEYDVELTYKDQNTSLVISELDVANTWQDVKVNLVKVGEQINGEYAPLGNVTFGLYAKEDIKLSDKVTLKADTLIQSKITDENGQLSFERKLPLGSYYIQEILADENYVVSDKQYEFEFEGILQEQPLITIDVNNGEVISNELVRGGFELTKTSENGELLEGVEFDLLSRHKEYLGTYATDENGKIKVDNLIYGDYLLVESKSANGHQLLIEPILVQIRENQVIVEVQAVNKLTVTHLLKVDENGEPLVGATLQVLDQDGNVVDEWISTDQPHEILGLEHGNYILHEVSAPTGYRLMEDIEFEVTDQAEVLELQAVNELTVTHLLKVDENGEPLVGATLQVLDQDGNVVDEWISTDQPHEILGLAHGKYILHEVSAPSGYRLMEDIEFEVTDQAEILEVQAVNLQTEVHIDKYDPSGNKLIGAIMQIINKLTGEIIDEWTTTDETKVIEGLEHGDYILREITAPNGYQQILDIEFTVTDENMIHVFEVVDELTKTTIRKVDEKGNLLSGAHLQIIDEETGEIVKDWVTTTGEDIFEGLAHRAYRLHEVEAPPGYELAEDIIFTVTDENGELIVTMVDKAIKIVPQTGLDQNLLMVSGVALVAVGTAVMTRKRKK